MGVVKNNDLRYTINDGQEFSSILQAQLMLAIGKNAESFEYKDVTYDVEKEGEDLYAISSNGRSEGHRKCCRRRRGFCIDFHSQT